MSDPTRRQLLESGLALGLGAVAGCIGAPGGSTPSPSATPSPSDSLTPTPTQPPTEPTPSPTPSTPAVADATIRTLGGTCGDTPGAEITQTDDGIRVNGTIVAPTPCHEARLVSVSDEGREARFTIDVAELSGTQECAQCIADISFELTATFRGSFDTVVVVLQGNEPTTVRTDLS